MMKKEPSTKKPTAKVPAEPASPAGSQTLLRGLDVLESAMDGSIGIAEVAEQLQLTRSTAHRLASALVDRRYLTFAPGIGYRLGPKLLELGYSARHQVSIGNVARPYLEALARETSHTIHLGALQDMHVLYLDKVSGRRRIEISSRVGELQPITSTGLGKALMLDEKEATWRDLWIRENPTQHKAADYALWLRRMTGYVEKGYAFDLEENEDNLRCVGAPIRDASGSIVAAISLSSAAQYMSHKRMDEIAMLLSATVKQISRELGWLPPTQ